MPSFYTPSVPGEALRQGELLSFVVETNIKPGFQYRDSPAVEFDSIEHELAIVLSQDCDLSTDHLMRTLIKNAEEGQDTSKFEAKKLSRALLCEVDLASTVKTNDSGSWDRISKNNDPRFHFLQKCAQDEDAQREGLDSLIVNFKQPFTVTIDDLLMRILQGETKRRFCMQSPYFEHVSDRFAHYLARVGLPNDHDPKRKCEQ